MNDWTVDTSVMIKWVLAEPDSALALKVVADVAAVGGSLAVLDLGQIEAANVLWVRNHRGLLTQVEAKQALALLQASPVQVLPALPHLADALDIAARHGIAVYDALFVAVTRSSGRNGVTADEPLVRAVRTPYPEIKLLRNW